MPIKEFKCPLCGQVKEVFILRKIEEASLVFCMVCNKAMEEIPSVPAPVQWKGGKPTP